MPADRTRPAAFLWDFDGTLADSEPNWHNAERRLMAELGSAITPEQNRQLVGSALVDSAAQLLAWAGREDLDAAEYAHILADHALADMLATRVGFRPGATELLAEVRAAGIACALVSASYTSILEAITAQLPAHSFDLVIGGDQVKNGKPHPEPYLTAASRLGVAPIDCLVLEDSVPGTLSAENAGMPTLGVPFEQPLTDGPRRRVIPTLSGLTLAAASELWRELAHA